jgi:DNA-binding GntR family transcriptional regulator
MLPKLDLPETVRSLVWQKAEGNPFFVEEVLKALIEKEKEREADDLYKGFERVDPRKPVLEQAHKLPTLNLNQVRALDEIWARMPTPDEVRTLSLPPGVPVFRLVRTAYDRDGRAVEVCDTIMAADAYLLAYDLPAH